MKILKYLIPIVVITLVFGACKYDFILQEELVVIDPDDPNAEVIGFAEYILPIFNDNNNCTSCHKTGDQMPDLTAGNAYTSLNSTRYLNRATPEESKIYTYVSPGTSTHTHKKYTEAEAAIVLAWITQGAKNN